MNMMGRFSGRHLCDHRRLGDAGDFGKATIQRAVTPRRTSVLKRTLTLGLVGQHHFANGFATADGRIDEAHDLPPRVFISL
jgi:hypothetical protein